MSKSNPFKFGTVVDEPYFINRKSELARVREILNSANHLILISPRRFGKTSLIKKALNNDERKNIFLDIQLTNSIEDFAAQYLRRIYSLFPIERIRKFILNFRVVPNIALNPVNNDIEISFQTGNENQPILEDVLNLLEKLSSPKQKTIVVLDEFQDIDRIQKGLDRTLRSIMQNHQNINYIFLGSQESMMREIFEKKKSPFYHFGQLMYLNKIEPKHFLLFIQKELGQICDDPMEIANEIMSFTNGHPFYTQQLAYLTWNLISQGQNKNEVVEKAISETIQIHDLDFERLWLTFNTTDKKVLTNLCAAGHSPLSASGAQSIRIKASSTIFSSLKRLMENGYIIKTKGNYEIDDPFFREWIIKRRKMIN